MKTPFVFTLTIAAGLAFAKADNWNNQISAIELGENVRVVVYEDRQFGGASVELHGAAVSDSSPGSYANVHNHGGNFGPGGSWDNRMSSIKVIDGRQGEKGEASAESLQVRFFEHPDFGGRELVLEAGTEVAELDKHEMKFDEVPMSVHEWGTFTVVQGSDGIPISWYQEPREIVDLPGFVHQMGAFTKSGGRSGMDLVRMETPVLYFYPEGDEPLDISVTASFQNGRITEVFPPASNTNAARAQWRGTLLPPGSPERDKVPAAEGASGRHYAAARAVPEAWLFRGKGNARVLEMFEQIRKSSPDHHMLPDVAEPIDHFIFYRGAGSPTGVSIQARQDGSNPNKYTLQNTHTAAIPKLFALRVVDGLSSWVAINDLKKFKWTREGRLNEQSFVFPEPTRSASEMAIQLRSAMIATLADEGLTMQEAAAMVATWDDLWFTEPGTRVLAVLPQVFADEMVPLEFSPRPTSIERVFVARLELINRDQEAALMAVLNDPDAAKEDLRVDSKRLAEVELGRYTAGGLERAMGLVADQMRARFRMLKHTELELAAEKAQAKAVTAVE